MKVTLTREEMQLALELIGVAEASRSATAIELVKSAALPLLKKNMRRGLTALEYGPKGIVGTLEAAEMVGVSDTYIRILVRKGLILGTTFGRTLAISKESVEEYIEERRSKRPYNKK